MSDRELLELAAKAAGYKIAWEGGCVTGWMAGGSWWNPLEEDAHAFRLMVALGISTLPYPVYNESERHSVIAKQRRKSDTLREANPTEVAELYGTDPRAATRRAIVRAAAEIGRMK